MKQFKEMEMNEKERYLFDLNGYLHLKNVLSNAELEKHKMLLNVASRYHRINYRMAGIFPLINLWKL